MLIRLLGADRAAGNCFQPALPPPRTAPAIPPSPASRQVFLQASGSGRSTVGGQRSLTTLHEFQEILVLPPTPAAPKTLQPPGCILALCRHCGDCSNAHYFKTTGVGWQARSERGALVHGGRESKLGRPLCKTGRRFLKVLKRELPCDPVVPVLGTYPKKRQWLSARALCSPTPTAAPRSRDRSSSRDACPEEYSSAVTGPGRPGGQCANEMSQRKKG